MSFPRIHLFLFLGLFLPSVSFASEPLPGSPIPPAVHETLIKGIEANYDLNFEKAHSLFDSISSYEDDYPVILFGKTLTHWWYLSVYSIERDKEASQDFLKIADRTLKAAKEKMKKGDKTGEAHMVYGATIGLLGRWKIANKKWLKGYFHGRKTNRFLKKARTINPDLTDVNLGLGIYDYYVAKLPGAIRVLGFLGGKKNVQEGIDQLIEGARSSYYSRIACQFMLVKIYNKMERKPSLALPIINDLVDRLPQSPYLIGLRSKVLFNLDDRPAFEESVLYQKELFDKGVLSDIYTTQVYFFLALLDVKNQDWSKARDSFQKAIDIGSEKDPYWAWAYVYLGKMHDVLGNREEAQKIYRFILTRLERWDSHLGAKKYLKNAYTGENSEKEFLDF